MQLIISKIYNFPISGTDEEIAMKKDLIDQFRILVRDDIPSENVLYQKMQRYKDTQILSLYNTALSDINRTGVPYTNYLLMDLYQINSALLVSGSIIMSLRAEGIFQMANQIDYSDSGLSIAMFNKSTLYQSWWGSLVGQYISDKKTFKDGVIPRSPNAGFVGIASEFSYRFSRRTQI